MIAVPFTGFLLPKNLSSQKSCCSEGNETSHNDFLYSLPSFVRGNHMKENNNKRIKGFHIIIGLSFPITWIINKNLLSLSIF